MTFQLTVTNDRGETNADLVTVFVSLPPIADAGYDQTVLAYTDVALSAAASRDPDGTIVGYAWQQTAGASVTLTNAATAVATFVAPYAPGVLTFQVTVTDDSGSAASATVNVLVKTPPSADAGPDQFVLPGQETVTLIGTGSYDPDGTIVSYSWTQVSGTTVPLAGADTATPSFTPPEAKDTFTFKLTVTDDTGLFDEDFVSVMVNIPPVADAGPDQIAAVNTTVTLNGTGSYDPDGSISSYFWTQTSGTPVTLSGPWSATPSFTAPSTAGTLTFQLTVADSSNQEVSDTVTIIISSPPRAYAGPDQVVARGTTVTLDGSGSRDVDGVIVSYAWTQTEGTSVALTGADTLKPSFTAPNSRETLIFQLTVTDNYGLTASDIVSIDVYGLYDPPVEIGFSYRDISGTKLPIFNFDITTITTPFPIFFADNAAYTSLAVSSEGSISFERSNYMLGNVALPNRYFAEMIAPFWDNLEAQYYEASNKYGVFWEVVGTTPNRELVIEWRDVSCLDHPIFGVVKFQVVFFENSSDILFNYADVIFEEAYCNQQSAGRKATVGIQVVNELARQYSYETASLRDGLALLWKIPGSPKADADQDQSAVTGTIVQLNGAGSSDPDGTIVSHTWIQMAGTPVTLAGAGTATPSFTAPAAPGTLTFRLIVTDNEGRASTDTVTVLVLTPPIADAGPDAFALPGDTVTLNGAGSSDRDGTVAGYAWVQTAGSTVVLTGADTATPVFTMPNSQEPLTFRLTATDNDGLSGSDSVNVIMDALPTANAGPDQTVLTSAAVSLDGTDSSDPDGTIESYSWTQIAGTAVTLTGADTAIPSFTAPDTPATLAFKLTVTDDKGATASDRVNVVVHLAPSANAGPDRTVLTNASVSLDGTGSSDPDGTISSYSWTQTAGTSVTLAGSVTATPSFTAPSTSETLTFELTVTDDRGATASDSIQVTVTQPPVANAGNDQLVLAGSPVSLDGTGSSDPDGTIVSYSWTQTAGTSVILTGADTSMPSFTAPNTSETLTFELTVTDDKGATASDTVTVTVNIAPSADAGPDRTVLTNVSVSLDGRGSNDPGGWLAAYYWTQTAGTPVTLAGVDTATPSFTAPNTSETLTFELTVTDNQGATASDTVTIVVNMAPSANAGPYQTVLTNASVSLDGTGSSDPDGTIASYSWMQTAGTSVTLTGADTATPSFTAPNTSETLTFNLKVTDNQGAVAADSIQVTVNQPPVANAGNDELVLAGSPLSLDGSGSSDPDGTISGYSWTQTAGTSVTLTGADTATPSFTAPNSSETLTFELTVTDNRGATAVDTVSVAVNMPPIADAGADTIVKTRSTVTLDGAGSSDPDGTIASYSWTQTGGTAVSLFGANTAAPIFTAPDAPAILTFQLTVTDDDGATATDVVTITVTRSGK